MDKMENNNNEQSPLSNIDQIRLKRLAKLEQQQLAQKQSESASSETSSHNLSSGSSSSMGAPIPVSIPKSPNEPTQSMTSKGKGPDKPIESKPLINIIPRAPVSGPVKSFEDWQNDALSRILQVTLNPDASNDTLIFLGKLVSELKEEQDQANFRITIDTLDRVLVARLSIDPSNLSEDELPFAHELNRPLFEYLLDAWKRAADIRRGIYGRAKQIDENVVKQRLEILDQTKALLVSYSGLILQMPDMFPQLSRNASGQVISLSADCLLPRLLAEQDTASGLPSDFIKELIDRFANDGLENILGPPAMGLSDRIRNETILTDWRTPMNAFLILLELKSFSTMITELPNWNPPGVPPKAIELTSFLGPFMRISAFPDQQPQVAESYFALSESRPRADLSSSIQSLRITITTIQKILFTISNNIVRSSQSARENMLTYFATIIKANEKRAQMQVDRTTISGDGFMENLASVLIGLSSPFMDVTGSKLNKIDSEYFRNHRRIDVVKETKINATQEESDEWFRTGNLSPSAPNFITEVFYLTMAMLHYGPIRTYAHYNDILRTLKDLQDEIKRLEEAMVQQGNNAGPQAILQREVLKRYKDQHKDQHTKLTAHRYAIETHVLHPEILSATLQFYNFVMMWLVRMVDPKHHHPNPTIELPIGGTIPKEFAMLPEWIIDDVVDFWLFVGKYGYGTRVIQSNSKEELVVFIITFLKNSQLIKNPYLKAKLVEILFFLTYPIDRGVAGELDTALNSNQLALNHLMSALMSFYVEVEQTGASSQFYDKFNVRYNISQVIKTIWSNPTHRKHLHEDVESTSHREHFTRFVNMLMSDVTYLLDESLRKLSEIHVVQAEMESPEWSSMTPQQRQEREGYLRGCERQAGSYVALGNETVHMLGYMTSELVEPFMTPEIVDRLAAMLDYNLVTLVGPKRSELKVKNPEKYRFDPRHLLTELMDIYLHLCNRPEFIAAVARDGRSYEKKWFEKAEEILRRFMLKPPDEIAKLQAFVNKVEEMVRSGLEEEEDLGEIPDEFLDPVMATLMEDPVILPTSGITVDRSTIKTHLLGESRDPFNRAPLTLDMVQENEEMKVNIQNWKKERLAQKRRERLIGEDQMDTST